MKEITRRLYTKPVMLGFAFLMAAALVFGLFVTTKSSAQGPFIGEGDDKFETTGNGETFHNFQNVPIKADFFGPGSQQYAGNVPLEGVPLGGADGNNDTVIHRNACSVPCTTGIQMTKLNLKSINSITVTYNNAPSEAWNVKVNLSTFKTSTGSMSINAGGTFDSTLKVWPKFTFTRVSDNKTLTLDTGDPNLTAALTASDSLAIGGDDAIPSPTIAPAPCRNVVINEFEPQSKFGSTATASATATGSCAPVTLTSTNSPWQFCNGVFCIPRPITEAELWASHNASPPGTKKLIATIEVSSAVAE